MYFTEQRFRQVSFTLVSMALFTTTAILSSDEMAEREVVARLHGGDRDAITSFYTEYFPRLVRYARQMIRNETSTVEELVHVVLLKAIDRFESFRHDASLFSWVCAICRHEISDHFMRVARERSYDTGMGAETDTQPAVDLFAAPASDEPEYGFSHLQLNRRIHKTIDCLPIRYGCALKWKYLDGFTVAEIADRLEVSPKAAESVLARARVAFRQDYMSHTSPIASSCSLMEWGVSNR